MEAKKQKISHYELLMRACDKTKAEYERILTKEASTKHFWKTASPDFSKSEVKILKLEYKKAKLRRKAKKLSIEISELRLKAWAKTHDVEDKIYELSENAQSTDNQSAKSNKKAKKQPLAIVIVPAEIKKPSKSVEVEANEPKKRGKVAKPKPVQAVAAVEEAPKKRGKAAKPKPVEAVATVEEAPKKQGKASKPKPFEAAAVAPKKAGKAAKPKPIVTDQPKGQRGRPKTEKAPVEKPQDLTLLEGIGPKVMEILGKVGISTFAQLAAAKEENIRNILSENKFRFGNPATMIEQAKLAAAGKMTELEKLKAELKGGKRK
jgi:predicted flap endonuclease-1-like 5' DNA nuclease